MVKRILPIVAVPTIPHSFMALILEAVLLFQKQIVIPTRSIRNHCIEHTPYLSPVPQEMRQREKQHRLYLEDPRNLSLHSFLKWAPMSICSSENLERFLTPAVSAARGGRSFQKKNTRISRSKNARGSINCGNSTG